MVTERFTAAKTRLGDLKRSMLDSPVCRNKTLVLTARVAKEMQQIESTHLAAGVAYYALLSLFPLLLGLLALGGILLSSEGTYQGLLSFVTENLPGSKAFVEQNVGEVVEFRGVVGVGAILGFLWTASIGFGAVARSVNRAWGIRVNRPFYVAKPLHILMALAVGALFLISTSATSVIEVITDPERDFGIPAQEFFLQLGLGHLALRMVPWGINIFIFLMIYRFAPNCKTYWRYIWPGAVVAAVLLEVSKGLFLWYLDNLAIYNQVYGSVTSVIVLLFWIYVSALILILGAEIGAEHSRMRLGIEQGESLRQTAVGNGLPESGTGEQDGAPGFT
ncbi:MAG TPA: YihY/virulence factor BrkB family protein [Dehalococcoidia bacterium]|nr:YihY/virulence factor BrkB family protein [Dehalococcoidia bacterium]